MSDHVEEQEMEAEALTAIFDTAFEIISSEQPFKWSVSLYPVDASDEAERDELNHVGCKLNVELPLNYPDVLPSIEIEVIKVGSRRVSGMISFAFFRFTIDMCNNIRYNLT